METTDRAGNTLTWAADAALAAAAREIREAYRSTTPEERRAHLTESLDHTETARRVLALAVAR